MRRVARNVRLLFREEREEGGFGGGGVGDGFELGVVIAQRIGNFDFVAGEEIEEFEGVDDSLGLEVIVGDDESFVGVFGDMFDALGPGFEFLGGIQIVVAFGGRGSGIVAEPGVVAAAMEANVADGRSDAFAGLDGAADDGLVDIAEADAAFVEEFVKLFLGPGGVADFDDERVAAELVEEGAEAVEIFGSVVK